MSQAGLGLLGGTFDPVHCAHLRLARTARDALALERVLLAPAAEPALKPTCQAPAAHRLRMVELAVQPEEGLEASRIEIDRPGPSYTVDTLRELGRMYPDRPVWFLIGSDALAGLRAWREPEALLELAHFAVAARDAGARTLDRMLPCSIARRLRRGPHGWVHDSGHELRPLPFEQSPISSSAIRERLRRQQSVEGWVPPAVLDYIHVHRLYQEDS